VIQKNMWKTKTSRLILILGDEIKIGEREMAAVH
jgi:hypothetical protein